MSVCLSHGIPAQRTTKEISENRIIVDVWNSNFQAEIAKFAAMAKNSQFISFVKASRVYHKVGPGIPGNR